MDNFGLTTQKWLFKMKLGTKINSNMLDSIALFILYVLDLIHRFYVSLVEKIKSKAETW